MLRNIFSQENNAICLIKKIIALIIVFDRINVCSDTIQMKIFNDRILHYCSCLFHYIIIVAFVLKLWMNQPFNTTSCLESQDNETGEAKHVWSQIDHFIHCP